VVLEPVVGLLALAATFQDGFPRNGWTRLKIMALESGARGGGSAGSEQGVRDLFEGKDLADTAEFYGLLGHAEDHATCLVLRKGCGARVVHFLHSLGAVVAHSGEDGGNCVGAGKPRSRPEQHIDRRAVAAYERAVSHFDEIPAAGALVAVRRRFEYLLKQPDLSRTMPKTNAL
jgi:hypothetical protein